MTHVVTAHLRLCGESIVKEPVAFGPMPEASAEQLAGVLWAAEQPGVLLTTPVEVWQLQELPKEGLPVFLRNWEAEARRKKAK